ADDIAAGPFFPSPTKTEEAVLPLHILDGVVKRSRLPVFAIGGVNADNAGLLARHRVAGVAVVSAIMDAADPRHATEAIRRAFSEASRPGRVPGTRTRRNARARNPRREHPGNN